MARQGRRIVAALAVSLSLLTAFSATPAVARPTSATRPAALLGGAIVDARTVGGRVYVAYGNRAAVYTEDLTELVAEVTLSDYPTALAVDGVTMAVLLANGEIELVDLRDFATALLPAALRAAIGDVTRIALADGVLASSTAAGAVALLDVRDVRATELMGALPLDAVLPGEWWAMDMTAHHGAFYVLLDASDFTDDRGSVVAIRRDADGDWGGSRLADFTGQQARQIEVNDTALVVLTANAILLFDPLLPTTVPTTLALNSGSWPPSIALTDARLFALEWDESSFDLSGMSLAIYDIAGRDGTPERTAVALAPDERRNLRLRASPSHVFTFGRDELIAYDTRSGPLPIDTARHIVTVAASSAVPLADDRFLAARERGGVCAIDRTSGRSAWCAETGLTGQELFRADPWLVGAARSGIFVARTDHDGLDIVSQLRVDLTRERFVDVVPSGGGLLAVMDTNAPRAPKTSYRIDEIAIRSDGSIAIVRATDVMTPPCGRSDVRIAVAGTWLGLACERQVLEFALGAGGPVRSGHIDLPSPAQTIDVDDADTVAVGTTTGLVAFNVATRERVGPAPTDLGADMAVESIRWHGGCIVTIQVPSREARTVWRHCRASGGGYVGLQVYGYRHQRMHIEPARLEGLPDGVLFVTGVGTVVQLGIGTEAGSAYLPLASRFAQR